MPNVYHHWPTDCTSETLSRSANCCVPFILDAKTRLVAVDDRVESVRHHDDRPPLERRSHHVLKYDRTTIHEREVTMWHQATLDVGTAR